MESYEIIFTVEIVIVGAYLRGKIYEHKRNYFNGYT